MKEARFLRSVVCTVVGFAMVVAVAVQSTGLALTRRAPETALSMFPLNGLAQEELAQRAFDLVTEGLIPAEVGSPTAARWALGAYGHEPLTPEAHAILTMTEEDDRTRLEIVSLAMKLNRRNPRLQAVILQEQVAQQDYPAAVATLDRILRVRPSRSSEVFSILLPLFARDGAVEEFAQILDGTSPWHEAFFRYAVKEPAALSNLLELRKEVSIENQELDQALIKNLVAEGKLEQAYVFYQLLGGTDPFRNNSAEPEWTATYAPFDWAYSNAAGLRAQPSLNSKKLEISVRPGEGGVVARRLVKAPKSPFVLVIQHNIGSLQIARDIHIALRCLGADTFLIFDKALTDQDRGFEVGPLPASCSFVEIAIKARAWSGRSALNVEFSRIKMQM